MFQHLIENWKSSAANFLTLVVLTGGFFTAMPSEILQSHGVTQNEMFWGTVICGLAKLYVGLITKDTK